MTIDLGAGDGASDEVIFEDSVFNASILNWTAGEDALVDVLNLSDWTAEDNGTDTVLTGFLGQSITFVGVTGLGTQVDDFLI